MSSQPSNSPQARRQLVGRQRDTTNRLIAAAVVEVRDAGFAGLTVRNVAARAGVAPATAYNYFGSKEHLVAEVFWRRLDALEQPKVDRRRRPADRVGAALRHVALLVADEPELSAACTAALLADDPDVRIVRNRIGADIHERLVTALADDADPLVIRTLELAYSGAMVQTGTGHLSYADLGDRLAEAADLICGGK